MGMIIKPTTDNGGVVLYDLTELSKKNMASNWISNKSMDEPDVPWHTEWVRPLDGEKILLCYAQPTSSYMMPHESFMKLPCMNGSVDMLWGKELGKERREKYEEDLESGEILWAIPAADGKSATVHRIHIDLLNIKVVTEFDEYVFEARVRDRAATALEAEAEEKLAEAAELRR